MPVVEDSFLGILRIVLSSQFAYCFGYQPRQVLPGLGSLAESKVSVLQTKRGLSMSS